MGHCCNSQSYPGHTGMTAGSESVEGLAAKNRKCGARYMMHLIDSVLERDRLPSVEIGHTACRND